MQTKIALDKHVANCFEQNPFLIASREGILKKVDFARWAEQMFYLSIAFKGLMITGAGLALQQKPVNVDALSALSLNLNEEFGEGKAQQAHLTQLTELIETLGGTVGAELLPSTQICIDIHKKLGEDGLVQALAGVLANETCCQIEYRDVKRGVSLLGTPAKALSYFDINLSADSRHADGTRLALASYLPREEPMIRDAMAISVDALGTFYQGLWLEARPC